MFGDCLYLVMDKVESVSTRIGQIQQNIYTDLKKAESRLLWDKGKKIVKLRVIMEEC